MRLPWVRRTTHELALQHAREGQEALMRANRGLLNVIKNHDDDSAELLRLATECDKFRLARTLLEKANDQFEDKNHLLTAQRDGALEEARAWKERYTRLTAVYEDALLEAEILTKERRTAEKQAAFGLDVQKGFLDALEDQKRTIQSLQASVRRYKKKDPQPEAAT